MEQPIISSSFVSESNLRLRAVLLKVLGNKEGSLLKNRTVRFEKDERSSSVRGLVQESTNEDILPNDGRKM